MMFIRSLFEVGTSWRARIARVAVLMSFIAICSVATFSIAQEATLTEEEISRALGLLKERCQACHNSSKAEGDVVLENREQWLSLKEDRALVVPTKHQESLVWQLASQKVEPVMPPTPNNVGIVPLNEQELALMARWIDAGAPWPETKKVVMAFRPLPASMQPIFAAALTRDGDRAVAAWGNRAAVVRIPSGEVESWLFDPALKIPGSDQAIQASDIDLIQGVAISPDGKWIATGGFRSLRIWKQSEIKRTGEGNHALGDGKGLLVGKEHLGGLNLEGKFSFASLTNMQFGAVDSLNAEKLVLSGFSNAGPWGYLVTEQNKLIFVDLNTKSVTAVLQLDARPEKLAGVAPQEVIVARGGDRLARIAPPAEGGVGTLETPVAPRIVWEAAIGDPSGAVRQMISAPSESGDGEQVLVVKNNQSIARWNALDGTPRGVDGWPTAADQLKVSSDGKEYCAVVGGQSHYWRADAPANKKVLAAASPIQTSNIRVLQWDVQLGEKLVAGATEDLKLANDELTGEKTNLTTLEAEQKKATDALEAAKKEKEAKPDDAALQTKVTQAEASLQLAGEVLQRAKDRMTALEGTITKLQEDLTAKQMQFEVRKMNLATAQQLGSQGNEKIVATEFSRAPRSAISMLDGSGAWCRIDRDGQVIRQFTFSQPGAQVLLPLADGRWMVGWNDGRFEVFEENTKWDLVRTIGSIEQPEVIPDRVMALAFSADSKSLAVGSGEPSRSGQITVWDVESGAQLLQINSPHSDTVLSLAFSENGAYLASGGADRMAKVWNRADGTLVKTLEGHTHHVTGVAWRGDSRRVVTSSADTTIKVWNPITGLQIKTHDLGEKEVGGVVFSGLADHVYVVAGNGQLGRRNINDGRQEQAYPGAADYQFTLSSDRLGERVLSGGRDGILRVWKQDQAVLLSLPQPEVR